LSSSHLAALLAGVLAAALNFLLLTGGGEASQVAVLSEDVAAGAVVGVEDISYRALDLPADQLAGLFVEGASDSPVGQVAAVDLSPGDLLSRGVLRRAAGPSALRSFSIAVPPERAVAGAIFPGDRVDVLVAEAGAATWLAADLEVLAVAGGEGGIGLDTFSVTVAAGSDDIASIAAALASGEVSIVRATGAAPLLIENPPDA
jgi:Flp pilus assembly protein CpaB